MPAGRLQYRVEDGILVLTTVGAPSAADPRATFEKIRTDPQVPDGSPLLVDTRPLTDVLAGLERERRVSAVLTGLLTGLGRKVGPRCAILLSGANLIAVHFFQATADERGVRVGLFDNLTAARRWLTAATGHTSVQLSSGR